MGDSKHIILAINPGGTSTKISVFTDGYESFSEETLHPEEELNKMDSIEEQLQYRLDAVRIALTDCVEPKELTAVSGRGGPYAPCPGGVYRVDPALLSAFEEGRYIVEHPSLLGAPMAHRLAAEANCPAYIVDPVSVDEFTEVARITGLPGLERRSLGHALSIKSALREALNSLGLPIEASRAVVLHLGSGFTVAALENGAKIDSTDASASGPMAPTRTGSLPALDLLRLAFSGKHDLSDFKKLLVGNGGWAAHLGTSDLREIYNQIDTGAEKPKRIIDATIYQLVKQTAAMAAVLDGRIDALVITGGVARSERFIDQLKPHLEWLCQNIIVLPGEREMQALAEGALRALNGECEAKSMAEYLRRP